MPTLIANVYCNSRMLCLKLHDYSVNRAWRGAQNASETAYDGAGDTGRQTSQFDNLRANMERKCADTTGTVPVPWAGHEFQC